MMKISPFAMRRLRTRLAERFPEGNIPRNVVEVHAAMLDVTADHLARRLRQPDKACTARRELNEMEQVYLGRYRQAKQAYRALKADGLYTKSYPTFLRQVRGTNRAVHAAIVKGDDAARDQFVYQAWEAQRANEVSQQDSMYSKVQVVKDRSVVEPVIEVIIDDHSRLVTGIAFAVDDPNAKGATMALTEAIHGMLTPGHQPARPERLRYDQAKYYTQSLLFRGVLGYGEIRPDPVMGYSPQLKGKVERFNRTLRAECLDLMPGVRRVAQLLGQDKERDPNDRLLTWEDFCERVIAWVISYNTERPHSALGGRTPAEVFLETAAPAYDLDDEAMHLMLRKPDETRIVSKNGVRFRDIDYTHAKLTGRVGTTVEIGYRDSDPSHLELFVDGTWLCSALPQGHPDTDDQAFYAARQDVFRQSRRIRAMASKGRSGDTPDRQLEEEAEDELYDRLVLEDDEELVQ